MILFMKYISHYSSALAWDIPYLNSALGLYGAKRSQQRKFTDVTFSNNNERHSKTGEIVHYCGLNLPHNSVVEKNGCLVSSPQLLFLELANELDIHHLILFGLILVSHPPGKPQEALTNIQLLSNLAENLPSFTGCSKAKRALLYIKDGAASLMEALAFMFLTLPHSLGGYGLIGVSLNCRIGLLDEAQRRLGQRSCFIDLYYKKEKLAVEYDSFTHHNSPGEQAKDMLRASALERQGITVMRLGTVQLFDKSACEEFAYNLAHRLNRRLRIRNKCFKLEQLSLRALLPVQTECQPEQESIPIKVDRF